MAIWVNVHGGFPIGLVLISGYVAAHAIERWLASPQRKQGNLSLWLLCLLGSVAATLANPYGWRVYEYVGRTSSAASGRRIDEWLPPSLDLLTGKVWALSLLLLLIGLAFSRRRATVRELCVLGFFAVGFWLRPHGGLVAYHLHSHTRRPTDGLVAALAAI